jgi:hypothetical protein
MTNGSGSGSAILSLTFKMPTKMIFCLFRFEGTFTSIFKDKKSLKSHKTVGIQVFFLLILLDERRIRIRTSRPMVNSLMRVIHACPAEGINCMTFHAVTALTTT